MLRSKVVQEWLQSIEPVEQLLNAVLQIVHPQMWLANSSAAPSLLERLDNPQLTWPTVYPAMDLIANRKTGPHSDPGGAITFYDHLISFGQNHGAKLVLDDFDANLAYQPGTSVLFSGTALVHSVSEWAGGERLVIAHYAKDGIQDRVGVVRPLLPTQLGWWNDYTPAEES
jgi:hypothetical protein